ncbi:hypothetical protein OA249_03695 [Litorivicinus sp.]|nr:hypothetical protein [Litorivicinus sp.]
MRHYTVETMRWNRFRTTYGDDYKLYVHFTVELTTNRLGIFRLNDDRLDRLKLIKQLSDINMSTKEITDYLNQNNIKTPKGLTDYPKLVWVTLFNTRSDDTLMMKSKKLLSHWCLYIGENTNDDVNKALNSGTKHEGITRRKFGYL